MIYCLIYHWLGVSREVNISRARSANDMFTNDWPLGASREVDISRAQSANDIFTDDWPTTSDI